MERLVCLALICVVSTLAQDSVDPRGARPVQQGTRDEKCASQKEWPFCTDDEWGSKCPSGCRIQGLMDKSDHSLLKKIEKIRSLLDQNKAKHRSADQVSKQTYDSLKDKLIIDSGNDNNYYELAQSLRQRITDMKIKIDRQLRILAALKDRVKDQVVEMQRLEVDIDIKLRSCKGSCASYSEYQVDRESYEALNKQVSQLDNQMPKGSVGTLYVMKSKPLQGVLVDNIYKSQGVAGQQKESLFPEVQAVQLILTQEGSSTSPATISKDSVCMKLRQQSPEGRRPSLHAMTYDRQRCRRKSDVPMCSDDDWVSKCPSGCRLQGFISQMESEVERKLTTVCKTAKMYEEAAEKSMKAMTHLYNHKRRVMVNKYMSELKFVEQTEGLARNFSLMLKTSSRLSLQLDELNRKVKEQLDEMYRTEIDIDLKLRACRGSCHVVLPFQISHHSYERLQADMEQIAFHQERKVAVPPQDIPHIKLQPVDVSQVSSGEYKTLPTVQRELLTQFEDIGQNQILLEPMLEESAAADADTHSELD